MVVILLPNLVNIRVDEELASRLFPYGHQLPHHDIMPATFTYFLCKL